MKQKINLRFRFPALIVALLVILSACNESSQLGMDLLPTNDLINVKNLVEDDNFSAYTFTEGPIRTDEAPHSLLGSLYDPVFGITTINFATQFRILDVPEFGENPVADSVKLFLYYRHVYGDTVTPQTFRVYELQEPIFADTTSAGGGSFDFPYYQDVDLESMASDFLLGERTYTPVVRLDSASQDTFYQQISITLDNSLGQKLLDATQEQLEDNEAFLEYFKGLLIESEKQNSQGGSILSLEAAYSSTWQGSGLALYYTNDEYSDADTSLMNVYLISPFSARVNSIDHDYTPTTFYENLNQETGQDSLIYVQATGGLKSKILIDELSSWADSANVAINRAELVFQVDTVASDVDKYPPPSRLLFTYITEDGEENLPRDYWWSREVRPDYYGGFLDTTSYTYQFNITQHMQEIVEGVIPNNGFFLTTARKNSEANRVVIKGSESQTGIRLNITYSKYLE
ncbi:MAG: DUF4270 domain-containing protein [Mariniphaga sp.]